MAQAKQSPFQACDWDPCRDLVEWQTTPQHVSNFESVQKPVSVCMDWKRVHVLPYWDGLGLIEPLQLIEL